MELLERHQQSQRITLIGALVNLILGVLKIGFGMVGHSAALVADGVHSLSDLITDALVLFASQVGSQAADDNHPYGHGRIETAATVALALLLALVGVGIIADAVSMIHHPQLLPPSVFVFLVALVSIVANEGLYHYTLKGAQRMGSSLLAANAWHHRSDAASSVVVLIGITGTFLGYHHLDAIAAIIVGMMIVKMGLALGWSNIRELVDTAVDETVLTAIHHTIDQVSGVEAVHQLRTRSMGSSVFVDVHVMVEPKLTVSEGHYIGQQVEMALINGISEVTDVTVHVDPEDDEIEMPSSDLPSRKEIIPQLKASWEGLPGASDIQHVILHYLAGQLHIEVHLPFGAVSNSQEAQKLTGAFRSALEGVFPVGSLNLSFHP